MLIIWHIMCCVSCVGLKSHSHKRFPTLRHFFGIAFTSKILYIKATMSVCLCGQCLEDSSNHCPFPVMSICLWWQARQGGQGSRCRGPGEVPFLLKKSLGKTRGPASNQTKIQFFKKNIFIIEHIKKTRIFFKKKIKRK